MIYLIKHNNRSVSTWLHLKNRIGIADRSIQHISDFLTKTHTACLVPSLKSIGPYLYKQEHGLSAISHWLRVNFSGLGYAVSKLTIGLPSPNFSFNQIRNLVNINRDYFRNLFISKIII